MSNYKLSEKGMGGRTFQKKEDDFLAWLNKASDWTKEHKPRFKPKLPSGSPSFKGPFASLQFSFSRDDYQYPESLGISDFVMQDELEPNFWVNNALKPPILQRLMVITADFVNSLGLDNVHIDDIIITGSIANYNWSEYSDIDVHILLDFEDVDDNTELVKKFFDAKRMLWNKHHEIMVKGHEVEMYLQDTKETHVSSGVYSLLNGTWVKFPKKEEPAIDMKAVEEKTLSLMKLIDEVGMLLSNGQHKSALDLSSKIKNKVKRMRKTGLESVGVYSSENLAFKALRKNDYLAKLHELYTNSYDELMSMNGDG